MEPDAVWLFEQDFTRFLAEYRQFLENPSISDGRKFDLAHTVERLARQWAVEFGPKWTGP